MAGFGGERNMVIESTRAQEIVGFDMSKGQ